ncbi:MAG: transposase [Prevotella sp.]|nr:transposase [Prevotella sp.]
MNKKRVSTRAYTVPQVSVYELEKGCSLMHTSFDGQHKPGNPGGRTGDAKHNDFFDDEDWEEEENDEAQTSGLQW